MTSKKNKDGLIGGSLVSPQVVAKVNREKKAKLREAEQAAIEAAKAKAE